MINVLILIFFLYQIAGVVIAAIYSIKYRIERGRYPDIEEPLTLYQLWLPIFVYLIWKE